jgi:hypothetical protein
MDIVSQITQTAYQGGKSNRYFESGTVISSDSASQTAIIDVGAALPDGTPVYMHDIPYQSTTQPKLNNTVDISYANVSSHSKRITGVQVGANAPASSVLTTGGVDSLHADTSAKINGDIELASGTDMTLAQAGNVITFNFSGGTGVPSVNGITGAVTLVAGTNVTIGVAGGNITIAAASTSLSGVFPQSLTEYTNPPAGTIVLTPGTHNVLANANATIFQLPDSTTHAGQIIVICNRLGLAVAVIGTGADVVESPTGRNNVWYQSNGAGTWRNILSSNNP